MCTAAHCDLQGLYELKDHEGWTVSRDDDLQVMYRHHAGQCVHACHKACPPLQLNA